MTQHNRQFDDNEPHISDRLRQDLQGLFQPPGTVPARVDRTILDQAHRHLAKPRHLVIRLQWAAGLAAAAAVIVLGVVLFNPQSAIKNPQSSRPALAEGRADIDGNGRVDILDAFRLARSIEARGPANPQWDLNGDGRVDRDDVDVVAQIAVRLGLPTSTAAALGNDRRSPPAGWAAASVGCIPRTAADQEGLGAGMSPQTWILACANPLNKGV